MDVWGSFGRFFYQVLQLQRVVGVGFPFPQFYRAKTLPVLRLWKIGRGSSKYIYFQVRKIALSFRDFIILPNNLWFKKSHPLRGSLGIAHFQVMIETKQLSHPKIQRKRSFLDAKNSV